MSTAPSLDPKQFALQVKEQSESHLLRIGLLASLSTSERDDRFSNWLLVAAAAAIGLLLANLQAVQALSGSVVLLALVLLALSALCGLTARYFAHIIGINLASGESQERARQILEQEQNQRVAVAIREDILRRGDLATRDFFGDVATLQASKPDLGKVNWSVQQEIAAAQPRLARWFRRRVAQDLSDPMTQLRWLMRVRARQAWVVLLQLALFVAFLIVAAVALT